VAPRPESVTGLGMGHDGGGVLGHGHGREVDEIRAALHAQGFGALPAEESIEMVPTAQHIAGRKSTARTAVSSASSNDEVRR
jgi:hypothetical protein